MRTPLKRIVIQSVIWKWYGEKEGKNKVRWAMGENMRKEESITRRQKSAQ
jgi:hypothetical protein